MDVQEPLVVATHVNHVTSKPKSATARTNISDRRVGHWPKDCMDVPTDRLAKENPLLHDSTIVFEEYPNHLYFVDQELGVPNPVKVQCPFSVTSLIGAPFKPFDARKAIRMTKKRREEKYPGMSDDEILAQWRRDGEEASRKGSKAHGGMEMGIDAGVWSADPEIRIEMQYGREFYDNFFGNGKRVPFRTEPIIYYRHPDGKHLVPGSVDLVFLIPSGDPDIPPKVGIADWKRSKKDLTVKTDFTARYFGRGKFSHIPDTKRHHFALQVSTYATILEEQYGLTIDRDELWAIQIHPDNGEYLIEKLPDHMDLVKRELFGRIEVYEKLIAENKAVKDASDAFVDKAIARLESKKRKREDDDCEGGGDSEGSEKRRSM